MQRQGMLTIEELQELARNNPIDTVLCMFTDLQGRYMGKRVLPDFFIEEVLGAEGLHACLYLLAIDMEMEPLPGYRYASWETGYGDFRMIPDLTTLRWCPWIDKTAMVLCDIADEDTSEPVAVAPRQILKDQIAKAAADGLSRSRPGRSSEFYLFKDSFDELAERAYRDPRPSSPYIMDYHMLQTTEGRVVHPPGPQRHARRRYPDRVLQGRVRQGPARDQHHLLRTRCRTPTITRSTSTVRREIAALKRRGAHASWRNGRWPRPAPRATSIPACGTWIGSGVAHVGRRRAAPHERHLPVVPGRPDDDGARDGVDVRALRQLLQALPAGVVGADRDRVEPRQPHVRVPHGRRAHGVPRGMPVAGRRRELRTSPSLPRSRAGCGGSATRWSRRRCSTATPYEAEGRPARPDLAARGGRDVPRIDGRTRGVRATSCSSTC